jgi:hypothetical protein
MWKDDIKKRPLYVSLVEENTRRLPHPLWGIGWGRSN